MATIADLCQNANVPMLLADHRGIVVGINDSFTSAFGWTADNLVGRPLTTIIPRAMHDAHNLGFSRFLATGQPKLLNQPLELKLVARDRRELAVELLITADQQDGQWVFAASLRPLAARA
ncbi:PAS domain-containing protein [Nitrospira sp. Kam-Ns4a]